MNVLTIFEQRIGAIFANDAPGERLPFSFKRLAKRAVREMEDETFVIDGVDTAPALYTILVCSKDDFVMRPLYIQITNEISQLIEAQAKKRGYTFVGKPLVRFMVDPALRGGKFSVFAENIDPRTLARLRDEENAYLGITPPHEIFVEHGFVPEPVPLHEEEPAPVAQRVAFGEQAFGEPSPAQEASHEPPFEDDSFAQRHFAGEFAAEEPLESNPAAIEPLDEPTFDAPSARAEQFDEAAEQDFEDEFEDIGPSSMAPASLNEFAADLEAFDREPEDGEEFGFAPATASQGEGHLDESQPQEIPPFLQGAAALDTPAAAPVAGAAAPTAAEAVDFAQEPLFDFEKDDLSASFDVAGSDGDGTIFSAPEPSCMLIDMGTGQVQHVNTGYAIIGRERTENGVVVRDPNASRRHAELAFDGTNWRVRDLRSTNGTLVNDVDVSESVLHNGDILTIGLTNLEFRAGGR